MTEHKLSEDFFNILRVLSSNEEVTQRDLSAQIGSSLGKTNYLLKELIKRGFVSVIHFSVRSNKLNKVKYMLTKEGLDQKLKLTYLFLKRKEEEFNKIKHEWESLNGNAALENTAVNKESK